MIEFLEFVFSSVFLTFITLIIVGVVLLVGFIILAVVLGVVDEISVKTSKVSGVIEGKFVRGTDSEMHYTESGYVPAGPNLFYY